MRKSAHPYYQGCLKRIEVQQDVYVSVNSKPDHPPRATPGDSHIPVAPGVGFSLLCLAPGSAPRGVLNQSKSSIILKKVRFLLGLLNKWVAALFICLYVPKVSSVT